MTEEMLLSTLKTRDELKEVYDHLRKMGYLKKDYFRYDNKLLEEFICNSGINNSSPAPLERIKGAFLGCAVGDALGRFYEGIELPRKFFLPEYIKTEDGEPGKGHISDDTQMTMCIGFSLLDNAGLNLKDVAYRFAFSKLAGIGGTTSRVIAQIKRGTQWYLSGIDSAGNGAAMRCSPIGIYYFNDYESLRLASILQAKITHNRSMAIASAIVPALAVSLLSKMDKTHLDTLDKRIGFCKVLAEAIIGIEEGDVYNTRDTGQADSLYNRINNTLPELLQKNLSAEEANRILCSGAYVLESLPIAIYLFLRTPDDFKNTLIDCARYTHDSDTVGAIACAMSGAFNSDEVIEEKYLDTLEFRDYIALMAERFANFSPR